jgi:hypothetical protein
MGKAKKKGGAGGGAAKKMDGDEDDWEALLEAEASKNAAVAPAPADSAKEESKVVEDNASPNADESVAIVAAPGAQDAAAAFLAAQGISVDEEGEGKKDNKKKKKKKKGAGEEPKKDEKVRESAVVNPG